MACAAVPKALEAQTFDEAIVEQLDFNCERLREGGSGDQRTVEGSVELSKISPRLQKICSYFITVTPQGDVDEVSAPTLAVSSSGSGASQLGQLLGLFSPRQRAVARDREPEKSLREGVQVADVGGARWVVYPYGGLVTFANGLSVFVIGEWQVLDKEQTAFEDGYDSSVYGGTIGTNYRLRHDADVRLAFRYQRWGGDYASGGGFETDSYGGLVYGSWRPGVGGYIDTTFGFFFQDHEQQRIATFENTFNFGEDITPYPEDINRFSGPVTADYDGFELNASVIGGYDYTNDRFTVGLQGGFIWFRRSADDYMETGETGLELRVREPDRISVRSQLGLRATTSFVAGDIVLTPEVNIAWIHEFSDDQRTITASFVEDRRTRPSEFTFNTEKPDRDYGVVNAGLAVSTPWRVQPFAHAFAVFGNEIYENYGGSVGLAIRF